MTEIKKKEEHTLKEIKVRITFLDQILGTANGDPKIHEEFIASKAPDAKTRQEEIEAIGVDGAVEKAMTIFPKNKEGQPIFWPYQIKGFFKDACQMLKKVPGTESSKIKAYKKEIDGLIFIEEDEIPIIFDGEIESCQRPLRAQTMQGERVTLANSEAIPAGATIELTIQCMLDKHEAAVIEWLNYGKFRGLGQWRNSGKGRFEYELLND